MMNNKYKTKNFDEVINLSKELRKAGDGRYLSIVYDKIENCLYYDIFVGFNNFSLVPSHEQVLLGNIVSEIKPDELNLAIERALNGKFYYFDWQKPYYKW